MASVPIVPVSMAAYRPARRRRVERVDQVERRQRRRRSGSRSTRRRRRPSRPARRRSWPAGAPAPRPSRRHGSRASPDGPHGPVLVDGRRVDRREEVEDVERGDLQRRRRRPRARAGQGSAARTTGGTSETGRIRHASVPVWPANDQCITPVSPVDGVAVAEPVVDREPAVGYGYGSSAPARVTASFWSLLSSSRMIRRVFRSARNAGRSRSTLGCVVVGELVGPPAGGQARPGRTAPARSTRSATSVSGNVTTIPSIGSNVALVAGRSSGRERRRGVAVGQRVAGRDGLDDAAGEGAGVDLRHAEELGDGRR